MKTEMNIQQVKVQNKISYAEAVKMVGRNEGKKQEIIMEEKKKEIRKEAEGKVWIDLKKLVTFIAGVINATMETRSKTERIQIIVKAAANHLNLSELSWEEIRQNLSTQSNQEGGGSG